MFGIKIFREDVSGIADVLVEVFQQIQVIEPYPVVPDGLGAELQHLSPVLDPPPLPFIKVILRHVVQLQFPERFKAVVRKEAAEHIFRIEAVKIPIKSVPADLVGAFPPHVIAVRREMAVAAPRSFPLDGERGIQAERTDTVIWEHGDRPCAYRVLPFISYPVLQHLRERGLRRSPKLAAVADVEDPYYGELLHLLDKAVERHLDEPSPS